MTVIAAGFDGGMPKRRDEGTVLRREPQPQQTQAETRAAAQQAAATPGRRAACPPAPRPVRGPDAAPSAGASRPAAPGSRPPSQPAQPRQVQFDDDDLDVPDFLK